MNDELVVKEPSAPKRFRLHPEELAAILFALLVIARLAFPDLITRLPEFVKIFLAFLAVLVFPGFLITSWFSTLHNLFLRRVVYSFALGYAVWTIPSSLLMMLKSSWTVFYVIYFVVNLFLIGFTVYYLRFRRRPISADRQAQPASPSWKNPVSLILLVLLLIALVPVVNIAKVDFMSGDLMSYMVTIRAIMHDSHFSLTEPIFGTGYPAPLRMVINPWGLLPAFIANVTAVDPIYLFSRNLPPILVVLAVLAIYLLVMEFTSNRDLALFTTLFTVTLFLADPYPRLFSPSLDMLRRISADKFFLLFIVLPAGLALARRYFTSGQIHTLLLSALVGLGIGLTHPLIALFFIVSTATFVAASYLFVKRYRNKTIFIRAVFLAVMCLVVLIVPIVQQTQYEEKAADLYADDFSSMPLASTTSLITPYVAVHSLGIPGSRFPEVELPEPGDPNPLTVGRLYSQIAGKKLLLLNTNQYITHPDLLINWPSLLAILLTPFLLIWTRKDDQALLMFSTTIVYLFLSFNPILTPLIGRFITPWMVYRLTWPILVHYTLAYMLYRFVCMLASPLNKAKPNAIRLAVSLLPVVVLLVMAFIFRLHIQEFYNQMMGLENPVSTGISDDMVTYLRKNIDGKEKVILADLNTNPLVSSVLYRTYVVAHRFNTTNETFPSDKQDEAIQRLYDVEDFTNAQLVDDRLMGIIKQYNVDYVMLSIDSELTCQFPYLDESFQLLHSDDQYQFYQVLDRTTDDPVVHGNSDLVAENYAEAETAFKDSISQEGGSIAAYLGLSAALQGQGKYHQALEVVQEALKLYPQSICVNRRLGDLYVAVGDNQQAVQNYQALISLNSKNDKDYKTLGDLYWLLDQPEKADSAFQQAASILFGPQTKEYYEYLYGLFMRLGDEQRAYPYIQAAIDLGPSADVYLIAGYASAVSGSTEEAAILINKALQADPDQSFMIAAYTALGNLYLDAKKYDEAIAAYQQGIREGYYDMDWGTNFYLSIANVYQEMGDTERALAYYHMLERYDPATSGPYLSAGQIYKDQGNLPAAIEQFQKATYAEPFDVMPYLQIASIYQQVGMDEQMDAMYQTALGIDPYSDKVWLLYANRLLGTDVEKARQAYQKAMELNASNSAVYVGMGNIASTEQRWDDALANFYLAILRSPSSSQGFVALGDALGEVATLNEAANAYTQAIKADPENPGAYAKLSNTYRLMGEMSKAVEVDQEALQAVPDSVEALLSLANTYQEQKQYDQSAELYRRVLELDPTQVRPYLSLAEIALAQDNDLKTALEMYQAAVSTNPSYGLAITALGDFYFKQGQLDLAEQAYRLVLDQPEVSASVYLAVSNIQKMRGEWDQALLTLQTAVGKVSDPSEAYCNLAVYYIGRASLDDAKAAYQQAIQIEPENAQGYAGLAGLAIRLGEFDLAAQTLEQGAQNASDKSVIHTAQAVYLEATGDLKQAENELLTTILPPVISTEPYLNLAQFYRDAERFKDAISIYQQALLEFPYNMQLLIGMGQTYASLNRIDDAINWFQVAASADKSDPSPYLALSSLYSLQGKLPEAEQAAKQAVTIRPTSVDAYLTLAQVYDSMQRPELARWEYQEACKLDQSQADCLVGLSQLDWQSRDYAQSIANLQAAIAIQPSMAELYQSLAQNYRSQGSDALAEQTLSEGIDKAQDREAAWLARAEYYASLGKWEQAEGDYRTATQAYPYSQNAGLQLASFYAVRDGVTQAMSVLQKLISLPTAGAEAYTSLGDLHASKAGWGEAMAAYRKALSVDPQYSQAIIGMSRVLGQLGRREQALATLKESVNAAPQDVKLLQALGDAYLNALDYPSARQAYSQALELDPNSTSVLASLDNLDLIEGKSSDALNSLLQIAEDNPGADIFEVLAAQYQTRGEWHKALYWRQRATALEPFNGMAWLNLGNQYLTWQDLQNAEAALDKAAQYLPVSPAVLLSTGSLKQAQELDAEAEDYYRQAIDAAPAQIGAYVALSNLKLNLGETEEALQIVQTALEHTPAAVLAYQALGQYYHNQQDYPAAIQSYQEGLDVVPGAAELKVDQGNLHVEDYQTAKQELASAEGYYQSAQERYEKTLLMPNRDWAVEVKQDALVNFQAAQNKLARAKAGYEQAQTLPETAKTDFQQALVIQPNNTAALVGLGKVAEINAQWDEAIKFYQQGLSINPFSADLWNALGQVYLQTGLVEEARHAYWNALTFSPNNVEASTGIVTATQALSSWSIAQALENVAYSQYKWEGMIEYIRNAYK